MSGSGGGEEVVSVRPCELLEALCSRSTPTLLGQRCMRV